MSFLCESIMDNLHVNKLIHTECCIVFFCHYELCSYNIHISCKNITHMHIWWHMHMLWLYIYIMILLHAMTICIYHMRTICCVLHLLLLCYSWKLAHISYFFFEYMIDMKFFQTVSDIMFLFAIYTSRTWYLNCILYVFY